MTMNRLAWLVAAAVGLVALVWIGFSSTRSPGSQAGFDVARFGQLPVSYGGRYKPIDTVARNSLTILSGRRSVEVGGEDMSAIVWLLEMKTRPREAAGYPVFRIYNKEVLALLGLDGSDAKLFSYRQLLPSREQVAQEAQRAAAVDRAQRSTFHHNLLSLAADMALFESLGANTAIHNIPLEATGRWATLTDVAAVADQMGVAPQTLIDYRTIYEAYAEQDPETFNATTASLLARLSEQHPGKARKAAVEWRFNLADPFGQILVLYIAASLLIFFSWIGWSPPLLRSAWVLIGLGLLLHTLGLIIRVYLSGRPPVTNLYSSAVVVGWGVVGLSLLVEPLLKRGLGLIVGTSMGIATLLVAQGLSADGDTMAVLQAVLDTNFWLATHVIVITLGYVGVFLAGTLGIVYVLMGVLTPALTKDVSKGLARVIYGVICFATLASFVGTVLGGIWADQSWGRFWGWDPKENGALLIVLWCAILLHARWGGLVKARGIAVLAVFGNVVCAWSWFGTNLLGAGLHSYGFTDGGYTALLGFLLVHAIIIAMGTLPIESWFSGKHHIPPTPKA